MIGTKPLLALLLVAGPAAALTPVLPCETAVEGGMSLSDQRDLGPSGNSGLVVERYGTHFVPDASGAYVPAPTPVPQLEGFIGARVTECRTGLFLAVPNVGAVELDSALSATEFLRAELQAGGQPAFEDVRRAAEAVFGSVLVLRETEETCGCNASYPDLRPAGMTSFRDRADQQGDAP